MPFVVFGCIRIIYFVLALGGPGYSGRVTDAQRG
jgi:hypothetical protein